MGEGLDRGKILLGEMQEKQEQPLILSLRLDAVSESFFNEQRKRYFPRERNFINAHLTLFHQLPAMLSTYAHLENLRQSAFDLEVTGLMSLGAGVAYRIESEELHNLRKSLATHFAGILIPQDRQGFKPHVTIQNKVTPYEAQTLLAELNVTFQPFQVSAIGLDLWTYLGGPWQHESYYSFTF